jgi:hypothetical protein
VKENPYLSIVIVGRNDNYGANFLERLNVFIKSLDNQTASYKGLIELIIVEWNPLQDNKPLSKVIYKPNNLEVRIITVPREIHDDLKSTSPVLEFYGKNVGVCRAQGEFILVTNPDIIFTQNLIDVFSQKSLKKGVLYRTDRYDYNGSGIELLDPTEYEAYAIKNTFKAHLCVDRVSYTIPVPYNLTLQELPKSVITPSSIHTNASGDFILADKNTFIKVGGLWETIKQKWHLDSYSTCKIVGYTKSLQVFTAPNCIFHMDHPRKDPDVAYDPNFAMEIFKDFNILNQSDDWGLNKHKLKEWKKI